MRPWTAKPPAVVEEVNSVGAAGCRVPPLMELCMDMISNNLHTFPSIDYLPSHLLKDILDRQLE